MGHEQYNSNSFTDRMTRVSKWPYHEVILITWHISRITDNKIVILMVETNVCICRNDDRVDVSFNRSNSFQQPTLVMC